jgi:hypothetical protein
MFRYLLSIIFLLISIHTMGSERLRQWLVSESSRLEVLGSSNVNSFTCGSDYFNGKDRLTEVWNRELGSRMYSGQIVINVNSLDCQNRIMNNDLQEVLLADEHPAIKIEFINLREVMHRGKKKAEGMVEITITGKKKRYPVVYDMVAISDDQNILVGRQTFRFSDFGLQAPQKAFGMIKVKDEITVEFKLILELMESLTDR